MKPLFFGCRASKAAAEHPKQLPAAVLMAPAGKIDCLEKWKCEYRKKAYEK